MQIKNEKPPILDKILAAGMHPNLESTILHTATQYITRAVDLYPIIC